MLLILNIVAMKEFNQKRIDCYISDNMTVEEKLLFENDLKNNPALKEQYDDTCHRYSMQERIDNYLLGHMDESEKAHFEAELETDSELKEQYNYTSMLKKSIASKAKIEALMQDWDDDARHEIHRKRRLLTTVYTFTAAAAAIILVVLVFPFGDSVNPSVSGDGQNITPTPSLPKSTGSIGVCTRGEDSGSLDYEELLKEKRFYELYYNNAISDLEDIDSVMSQGPLDVAEYERYNSRAKVILKFLAATILYTNIDADDESKSKSKEEVDSFLKDFPNLKDTIYDFMGNYDIESIYEESMSD